MSDDPAPPVRMGADLSCGEDEAVMMSVPVADFISGISRLEEGDRLPSLMKFSRCTLVNLANHLGAGDVFHKRVRKRTIVQFIIRSVPSDRDQSEGVFQLGTASST